MAKPEWGTKRICHSCGTRFYDLLRDPIVCPSCGTQFDPEALLRTTRSPSVGCEREPGAAAGGAPQAEAAEASQVAAVVLAAAGADGAVPRAADESGLARAVGASGAPGLACGCASRRRAPKRDGRRSPRPARARR